MMWERGTERHCGRTVDGAGSTAAGDASWGAVEGWAGVDGDMMKGIVEAG